jgi:hypothetical protein
MIKSKKINIKIIKKNTMKKMKKIHKNTQIICYFKYFYKNKLKNKKMILLEKKYNQKFPQ